MQTVLRQATMSEMADYLRIGKNGFSNMLKSDYKDMPRLTLDRGGVMRTFFNIDESMRWIEKKFKLPRICL